MSRNNNKKMKGRGGLILLIAVICAGIAGGLYAAFRPDGPAGQPGVTTDAPVPSETAGPSQNVQIEMQEFTSINLGYGLEVTDAGGYTGAYMEDGSDEIVSDVMMIVVQNSGDSDIQYGKISVSWGDEICTFSVTNLSTGSRAVLLEQDRKPEPDSAPVSAVLEDAVLFSEPMDLCEDQIEVSGLEGMLNVKNISGEDISGDVYVYYKYAAEDLYYGGITFRVRIEGGLKAGELRQIPAGHYTPGGCAIVQVVIVP